jgi:hypothetical protein
MQTAQKNRGNSLHLRSADAMLRHDVQVDVEVDGAGQGVDLRPVEQEDLGAEGPEPCP